jgi:hypothetical protein
LLPLDNSAGGVKVRRPTRTAFPCIEPRKEVSAMLRVKLALGLLATVAVAVFNGKFPVGP